jgi:arginine decarboxylase
MYELLDNHLGMYFMHYYTIVSGIGCHYTKIGSFDQALLDAGIGNYNLVKVSSILPPGCEERKVIDLRFGSILYTAYTSLSAEYGSIFSSAIAVGLPQRDVDVGIIMEYSEFVDIDSAKNMVIGLVDEAMQARGIPVKSIISKMADSKSIKYDKGKNGIISTFAGIALWDNT